MRLATLEVRIGAPWKRAELVVEIMYRYYPPERMVRYYPDGSGDPGCPADAELERVTVVEWLVPDECRSRGYSGGEIWDALDCLAAEHIERNWDVHRLQCVQNSINERFDNDCDRW